jgi:hypothetical protein
LTISTKEGRNRRYFPRVSYRAYASLITLEQKLEVHILDISFNGALAAVINKHRLKAGDELILTIETDENTHIKMQGRLAHQNEHLLGIECRATGIDNQTKLRELIEKYKIEDHDRSVKNMLDAHDAQ